MKKFFIFLPLALVSCFIVFNFALAAEPLKYQALEPIDLEGGAAKETTASAYIENFLTAFMAVIVAMAIFMVVKGGITIMMVGDNSSKRTAARGDIMQAIYGLILAILTYTILYKINPRLIPGADLFKFKIESGSTGENGGGGGGTNNNPTKPAYEP